MADLDGISYIRTLRPATPVIYGPDEDFEIGGSRTIREGDDVAIVAAGVTVPEAVKAADALAQDGIEARVIDLYSIKPLDEETIRSIACPIVTVEDHWPEGGLGEAVLSALARVGEPPAARAPRGARDAALRQARGAARRGRHRRGRDRGGRASAGTRQDDGLTRRLWRDRCAFGAARP